MTDVTLLSVDAASLYRGPLEDFVARRTALVRELRHTDREAADAVGKLRKPSAGVWAIGLESGNDLEMLFLELTGGEPVASGEGTFFGIAGAQAANGSEKSGAA